MQKRALVCDDHGSRVEDWRQTVASHLGDSWEVTAVGGNDLATMVAALSDVEARSRAGASDPQMPLSRAQEEQLALLNNSDLVIFDSDLTPSIEDSRQIGEEFKKTLRNQMGDTVARQIRSFTTAGFVAVINMYWGNYPAARVFDLTMMQGWRSHADLHLSEAELEDNALWTGRSESGRYHPWHWVALETAHELVRRSEAAITNLDAPVLPTLGLDAAEFSPSQLDLFRSDEHTTFNDLVTSELGFRYPRASHDNEATRRMAASVVRRWASRTLLAAQNVVTDAPHLIARLSPLLGEAEPDETAWQAVTDRRGSAPSVLERAEDARLLSLEPFLDRPVYSIQKTREILGKHEPLWLDPPDLVFAEDISEFIPSASASGFESNLPGPYTRRFVAKLDDVNLDLDYEPSPRLLQ